MKNIKIETPEFGKEKINVAHVEAEPALVDGLFGPNAVGWHGDFIEPTINTDNKSSVDDAIRIATSGITHAYHQAKATTAENFDDFSNRIKDIAEGHPDIIAEHKSEDAFNRLSPEEILLPEVKSNNAHETTAPHSARHIEMAS